MVAFIERIESGMVLVEKPRQEELGQEILYRYLPASIHEKDITIGHLILMIPDRRVRQPIQYIEVARYRCTGSLVSSHITDHVTHLRLRFTFRMLDQGGNKFIAQFRYTREGYRETPHQFFLDYVDHSA